MNPTTLTPEEKELKAEKIAADRYAYVPVTHEDGGFTITIAVEDIKGYFPTGYHTVPTFEQASDWAAECNRRLGRTEEEASDIVVSTMRHG